MSDEPVPRLKDLINAPPKPKRIDPDQAQIEAELEARQQAELWEANLQAIEYEIQNIQEKMTVASFDFLICVVLLPIGLGIILVPIVLFNYFRRKNQLRKLKKQRLELLSYDVYDHEYYP